jgi:peptidyl-prolyl cis-trans isomerase D
MLKTMRKNVQSLKWVLWLVIGTFIASIFFIWGLSGEGLGRKQDSNAIATVGRERITLAAYSQALRSRIESVKSEFKDINKALIEQLNLPQQVLEQMVEQALLMALADELGLRASDQEVAKKIMSFPGLQQDGKFIGYQEYKQRLQWNHINITDFENSLRKEIVLAKTVQILTAGVTATQNEIWDNYKKTKDSAKIEYLALEKSKVELDKKLDAAEVQATFEKNKAKYKLPEKREAVYVFLKNEDLKKEIELGESEIEKYYKSNPTQFQNPEKVKVSRIFLSYTDKDRALVQAEAQSVLAKVKAGEDFAALAKAHSKDKKAQEGGDWGLYDWRTLNQMEQTEIGKLAAGKTSDLVALDNGFSILKVTEKEVAAMTPLSAAKPQIRSILQDQKARELAAQRITLLAKEAKKDNSLEAAAKKAGQKIQSSGLLKTGQALGDFDPSGSISAALFQLKEKEISAPIYTYGGVGLAALTKIEAPRAATFDEVKTEVENDVTEAKKMETVLAKIKEARARLTDRNWEDVAQKSKLEIKTVDAHKKEQYIGLIGENKEIDNLAFSLPLKQVSEPVAFETGYCLIRVLDRKEATKADFEKEKETETNSVLELKKNKFLQSYLTKLRTDKGGKIRYDLYLQATQDVIALYDKEK